ncbi:MAG TPA: restriction endonuclease subunit S [Verrucomicrobiae bacterium]
MSNVVTSWPMVSLFDFCNPKQWPTIPQTAFVEQGYPVYGANGKIGQYTEFNHEKPTVLITCRGATCGTINVCEAKSYVTGNAMALDDLDESRVSAEYLVYALRNGSLAQAISGTAQPQITRQSLTAISIPLPPLAEQRRIAEVLDRTEALRAKRRAALAQFNSLAQSLFLDLFGDPATNPKGWPVRQLQEIV